MLTMQAVDTAFLLVVAAHAIIVLQWHFQWRWWMVLGFRCTVAAIGFLALSVALNRLTEAQPENAEFFVRLGFDFFLMILTFLLAWAPVSGTTIDKRRKSR